MRVAGFLCRPQGRSLQGRAPPSSSQGDGGAVGVRMMLPALPLRPELSLSVPAVLPGRATRPRATGFLQTHRCCRVLELGAGWPHPTAAL